MIDLHCHILPGLDDGAADERASVALASAAEAGGVGTVAATPHIRDDYPFPVAEIGVRTRALNERLAGLGIALAVIASGELSLTKGSELDDTTLQGLCLGESRWLLVESPYTHATDFLENEIFELQARGFRPLLAHPERSPTFVSDPARLATLVGRGAASSVTAASVVGRFGSTVQRAALDMFRRGLVHNISSDAHDLVKRPPGLAGAVHFVERAVPGLAGRASWFVEDAPAALLRDEDAPAPPAAAKRRWTRR